MFIAEEFYDVEMIDQLKFLHQILSSFPPLNTVNNCLSKNKPFLVPNPPHNSCCFYGHDETNEKLICSSELIMYKLACEFSLYFSRTFMRVLFVWTADPSVFVLLCA